MYYIVTSMYLSLAKFKQTVKLLGLPHFYVGRAVCCQPVAGRIIDAVIRTHREKAWRIYQTLG